MAFLREIVKARTEDHYPVAPHVAPEWLARSQEARYLRGVSFDNLDTIARKPLHELSKVVDP